MKKKLSVSLSLLLSAVLLLAGCTAGRHDPIDSGTKAPALSDTLPDSTQETLPPDTSGPEQPSLPFPTEGAPQQCLTDLTGLTAGKVKNTYLLDFIRPDICGAAPELYGNLLLCANQIDFSSGEMPGEEDDSYTILTIIDLSERCMTAELQLRGLYSCGFLENGNVYCIGNIYSDHFSALVLDQGLHQLYAFQAEDDASVSLAQFSSDGAYLAYSAGDASSLTLLNTETGVSRQLDLDCTRLYAGGFGGDYLYLNQYASDTQCILRIDPKTGEISKTELPASSYAKIKDGAVLRICSDLLVASGAENPGLNVITGAGEDAYAFDCRSGRIAVANHTFDGEQPECRIYDMAKKCVWRTYPENSGDIGAFVLSDQGFVILQYCNWAEDSFSYLLWDYLAEEPEPIEVNILPEDGIGQLTADIAAKILSKTGIPVFYGGAGNDFDAPDYVSKTVTDPFVIYSSMREAEAFFDALPDGMAQELCAGGHEGIRLYLCGKLYRTTSSGITTAAALTFSEGAYRAIAIDISLAGIRQNLAHEISHIIDDRLNDMLLQTGADLLGAWENMCPPGFVYSYSYNDTDGNLISNPQYTAQSDEPDENVWFVDAYAKSFPTEDRARVFENLFSGNDYSLRGEHLMQKARYYCAMLRYAFPSVKNAENPVWEKLTGRVDPSEFPDIFTSSDSSRTEAPDQSAANTFDLMTKRR